MRKLFFHIGRMKTGTTAIQNFLSQSNEFLLAQGFYYPQTGLFGNQHAQIAWSCFDGFLVSEWHPKQKYDGKSVVQYVDDLCAEIDRVPRAKKIILSSELITQRQPHNFQALISLLAAHFDLKLVCYLRRQSDAVRSSYKQQVLYKGITTQWSDFTLAEADFYSGNEPYFDYFAWIQKWADIVDRQNILLRIYKSDQPFWVLPDFLETIGFDSAAIDSESLYRRERISIDAGLLDFICHANRYIKTERRHEFIQDIKRIPVLQGMELDDSLALEANMNKFEASNKALAKDYFNRNSMPW